jgi:hypothetical protein
MTKSGDCEVELCGALKSRLQEISSGMLARQLNCLAGKDCAGDPRMAALSIENERLADERRMVAQGNLPEALAVYRASGARRFSRGARDYRETEGPFAGQCHTAKRPRLV